MKTKNVPISTSIPRQMEQDLQTWMEATGMNRSAAFRDLFRRGLESVGLNNPLKRKQAVLA